MRVEVFRCDHTQKVFFGIDDYRHYLRGLAGKRILEKKRAKAIARVKLLLPELRRCSTFESIAAWIEDHAQELREAGTSSRDREQLKKPFHLKDVKFTYFRRWEISSGYGSKARTGPGWLAEMRFNMMNGPSFDIFSAIPFVDRSGSGNSATGDYGISISLFDEDWPSLAVMHRMEHS